MAAPDKNAIRILVLDDEPLMLEFLADTLGALGYSQVTTCGSGYRALKPYWKKAKASPVASTCVTSRMISISSLQLARESSKRRRCPPTVAR